MSKKYTKGQIDDIVDSVRESLENANNDSSSSNPIIDAASGTAKSVADAASGTAKSVGDAASGTLNNIYKAFGG